MSSYSEGEKMDSGNVSKEKNHFINAYMNEWKACMKQTMKGNFAY
jgi:hypothetical protein